MSNAAHIILCGRSHEVGDVVVEYLKPEYEVIGFITSPEQGAAEIPPLLKGDKAVFAIVAGGGYDDKAFTMMKEATEAAGCKPVPWLRADTTKPGPKDLGPGYAKIVAERAKAGLNGIERVGNSEEVFLY